MSKHTCENGPHAKSAADARALLTIEWQAGVARGCSGGILKLQGNRLHVGSEGCGFGVIGSCVFSFSEMMISPSAFNGVRIALSVRNFCPFPAQVTGSPESV
jgi:hypothetical protein